LADQSRQKETLIGEVQSLSEQVATLTTSLQTSDSGKAYHVTELGTLRTQLDEEKAKIAASTAVEGVLADVRAELGKASERASELEKELEQEKVKLGEQEKEHEDLLVLLEELSQKRKRDRTKLKDAGLSVSDAEDEEGGEEDEE
jgi:Flp pilus assembly CpaE family ATPase